MPSLRLATPPTQPPEPVQATGDFDITQPDLAIYAALAGRKPVVEIVPEEPGAHAARGYLIPEAAHGLRRLMDHINGRLHVQRADPTTPRRQRVAVWLHGVSTSARKRIDQARMRLAG